MLFTRIYPPRSPPAVTTWPLRGRCSGLVWGWGGGGHKPINIRYYREARRFVTRELRSANSAKNSICFLHTIDFTDQCSVGHGQD